MSNIFITLFLLIGAFFIVVAAIGMVRLPDLYTRIHAATKATSFGLMFLLLAASIYFGSWTTVGKSLLLMIFIYLTAPLAASAIAKAAKNLNEEEDMD
ncbi:MAG: monovalent cation/H(+) antiporter subunit G [Mangrovibacterium sp.]